MTMTPFAPRTPYIVMSAASFSALIDAMSYGLIPVSPPSADGWKGTPSTMYSGALLPYVELDPLRMRTVSVPSDACPMTTPAEREARYCSGDMVGCCAISAEDCCSLADAEAVGADCWSDLGCAQAAAPTMSAT